MQAELKILKSIHKSLEVTYNIKCDEERKSENLIIKLEDQVEKLKNQLNSVKTEAQNELKTTISNLDKEWEKKWTTQNASISYDVELKIKNLKELHMKEMERKCYEHEKDKKMLSDNLKSKNATAGTELDSLHEELTRVRKELQEEMNSNAIQLNILNKRNREDAEEAEEKKKIEFEILRVNIQNAAEEKERLACEGHRTVIEIMKEMYDKAQGKYERTCSYCHLYQKKISSRF
jgi:hypothetical protein